VRHFLKRSLSAAASGVDSLALVRAQEAIQKLTPVVPGTAFYLDPANSTGRANDQGPGSASIPFLTTAPLAAYSFLYLTGRVDIYVMSDFPAGAPTWQLDTSGGGVGPLWIHGTQVVLASATLTAIQEYNIGANIPLGGTVTGFNWTPYLGNSYIRIKNGALAGYVAPIRESPSLGVAIFGSLDTQNPFQNNPAQAQLTYLAEFDIIRPTYLPSVVWHSTGVTNFTTYQGNLTVTDCQIYPPNNQFALIDCGGGFVNLSGCILGNVQLCGDGRIYNINGFWLSAVLVAMGAAGEVFCGGGCIYQGFVALNGGFLEVDGWGLEASFLEIGANGTFAVLTLDTFNCDSAISLAPRANMSLLSEHQWWGTGNTTYLVDIGASATLTYGALYALLVTCAANEFQLDGQTSISFYATDGTFKGPVQTTFAKFKAAYGSGGFAQSVTDPLSGASFRLSTI
jgi:hypothetical protein